MSITYRVLHTGQQENELLCHHEQSSDFYSVVQTQSVKGPTSVKQLQHKQINIIGGSIFKCSFHIIYYCVLLFLKGNNFTINFLTLIVTIFIPLFKHPVKSSLCFYLEISGTSVFTWLIYYQRTH